MGERLICNQEVTGSIPVGSTNAGLDSKVIRALPSSLDGLLRSFFGNPRRLTSYREIHIDFVLAIPREGGRPVFRRGTKSSKSSTLTRMSVRACIPFLAVPAGKAGK